MYPHAKVTDGGKFNAKKISDDNATVVGGDDWISKTVQSQAEEADINVIVRRFGLTGQMPEAIRIPTYGDFEGITDYHQALTAIARAQEPFRELTPELRARFNNDPGQFVDFCLDPKNLPELRELGLAKPLEEPVEPTKPPGGVEPQAPPPAPPVKP